MKENSLDSHRGKVAESKAVAAAIRSESTASTNFDDDYNEWELGIGDLIIDLDADIEKNNEKQGTNQGNSNNSTGTTTNTVGNSNNTGVVNANSIGTTTTTANSQLHHHHHHHHQQQQSQPATGALQQSNFAMSSGKKQLNNGASGGGGGSGTGSGGGGTSIEHQATVDKGLKMKIKRTKPTKTSEAKHEIVKSDTKPNSPLETMNGTTGSGAATGTTASSGSASSSSTASATSAASASGTSGTETGNSAGGGGGKSKHASSKGRGGSHREKKERTKDKERDKDRGGNAKVTAIDVNGVLGPSGCSITSPTIKLANSTINVASLPTPTVNLGVPANVAALGLSAATVNGAGSSSTSGSGANGSSATSGSSTTANIGASGNTNACGTSGSSSVVANSGGATGAAAVTNAAGFGSNSGSNIANGGGSAPSAGVASLATAAVTPPSSINVKLEPKFPNVPISNFASIKLEDNLRSGSGIPAKRMRISVDKNTTSTADVKVERSTSPKPPEMHDMCVGTSVGTITEPECLGPCEPGTTVTLEGIVWQETEGGVLVVNVTWRGKTYVGTLLDCTKHDWAPPRFCESPTSDVESRTPKGRGKRGRANANATTIDPSNFTETRSSMHSKLRNAGKGRRTNNSGFTAPPSPAKAPESSPAAGVKRKGRPAELELPSPTEPKSSKRSRSQSRGTPTNPTPIEQQPSSPILIECPEPNCSKKYKHINGLRYHQTHAHHSNAGTAVGIEDSPDEQAMKDVSSENDESTQESVPQSPGVASSSSSSDKTHRSSPRPFTGKVPPPPPTSDQKPAVPTLPANGSGPVEGETAAANAAAPTPPPPPLECPPSSTPSSDLGTLAAVAVGDSKAPASKGPATGSGGGVLRYGQSNGGSSTSPVGSQCQTAEVSSAMTSPPVGASSKVTSPSSSSTLPVIIPCRATSPVPATAAPLALSPTPHQSPRHTAAVSSQAAPPPPAAQLQPQPPQTTASSQPPLAPIYHHHHHHHHPFTHPGSEPLIAECPPGAGVVLPSQPSAAARSTTGTPNGPSSHPLSPSIACGTVVGPSSPHTLSDRSKVKQEKADKYRLKVMTASPSSIPRTATPPSAAAVPSPSSSSTSSKSSLTGSTPPLLNLQPGMGGSVGGAVPSLPIAATLKPLQPKPTLLGDSPGVSGPLTVDGIKKEKSKHRRKNKDRDRERKLSASYSGAGGPVGLHGTADLGGALHAAAGLDPQDKLNGSVYAKMTDLLGKDGVSRLSSSDLPLDLNTSSADNGSTCNENVQSPAYSDISDANDTTPGLEPEVTCKDIKEDSKVKGSAEQNPTATAHNLSPYGGYPYYGQSPYVVSPMSTQSPPVSRQPTNADRGIKEEVPVGGVDKMPEEKSSSKEVASKHWSERSRSGDRVVDVPERVPANGGQLMPPTSHSSSDYQLQQQKLMQQQYAYSYNYSYHYMEQAYHHHMHLKASESSYKHHHHHHQQVAPPQQQHHQYGSAVADDKDRLAIAYKEQVERQKEQLTGREKCQKDGKMMDDKVGGGGSSSELAKQMAASQSLMTATKDRDSHHSQRTSQHGQPSVHQPGSKVEALSASLKEKQNENHQILKENIELKTQMDKSKSNYERYEASMMYHHAQRNEELMRYLMYHEKADGPKGPEDLQRKDDGGGAKHGDAKAQGTSKDSPKPSVALAPASHGTSRAASSPKTAVAAAAVGGPKDCKDVASSGNKKDGAGDKTSDAGPTDATKDKKETRVQEGQKPTMETQGPPPPTNSYAYMHSPYMQPAHYGPLTYDPTHSMYRGMNPMLMTAAGHYPGPTYLHPQMRYVTAPAGDPQTELANKLHPTKALDLLQHHASQYYATSHKIHELQEHAIKSPVGSSSQAVTVSSTKLTDSAAAAAAAINKNDPMCVGNHERRSPPLQRHLHTHHHTHVGVGYPILRQYDPYGGKPLVRH